MTKINKHQIFFIALSFVVLYVALSIQPEVLTSFNMENEKVGKIIIYSFLFFIGLIGVGHGALDGKIIWEHSKKISVKCKLYGVYILLVLLGAVLWVSSPFLGLSLLLLLSSVHFGFSDLGFLVDVALVYKICWGFTMTFLPILFKPALVSVLFFDLASININEEIFYLIRLLIILSIFILFYFLICGILDKSNQNSSAFKLMVFELITLIILAYQLSPLVWFALYFCGLHGLRAILISDFKFMPDMLWLISFTAPVLLFIFLVDWSYSLSSLLVVFPVLASLTVAHMLLPWLKHSIKT